MTILRLKLHKDRQLVTMQIANKTEGHRHNQKFYVIEETSTK